MFVAVPNHFVDSFPFQLKILAQKTAEKRETMSRGSTRTNNGSNNNERPSLRDITQLGGKLRHIQSDLSSLQKLRIEHAAAIRALRGQMLKGTCDRFSERLSRMLKKIFAAGTRKEEVVRFHRAKTDKEFAMILRERTLGPEHLEAQNQLRKDVRVCGNLSGDDGRPDWFY
jgi:nucleoporin NUP159